MLYCAYNKGMKEISTERITEAVRDICGKINCVYQPDVLEAIKKGRQQETSDRSIHVMDMLIDNASIAEREQTPICQDTGMVTVWLSIGQEVCLTGKYINDAVNDGVRLGYHDYYLRASIVNDPLFDRKNTTDNTPAVIYTNIVPGDTVHIQVMAKGFGSENKSAIKMLTPAEGIDGVKKFVTDTVRNAGPNACPPFVVGVGIGGSFDYCARLSKEALLRPLSASNPDERYRKLEDELLEEINALHIGPMGFHGNTTALKVQIAYAPTHIAGLPCALNMCCHVCRHGEVTLS